MNESTDKQNNSSSFWAVNGGRKTEASLIGCMNMTTSGDFYKSEHRNEYIWHNSIDLDSSNKDELLKSEIKDKKLIKLKDAFKALAMRQ